MLAMCHMEPVKVKLFYFFQVDLIITDKEKQFNIEKLLSARPEITPTEAMAAAESSHKQISENHNKPISWLQPNPLF